MYHLRSQFLHSTIVYSLEVDHCIYKLRMCKHCFTALYVLEIGILIHEIEDISSYPIFGCLLRNLGLLLSRKFPPQLLCGLLSLALALHVYINGRWYVFNKCSVGVWQFLNLLALLKLRKKAMLPVVWCLGMAQMTLRYEYRQNFAELNFAVWSSSAKHAKIMLLENVASLVRY